jgi:hypothetical protein
MSIIKGSFLTYHQPIKLIGNQLPVNSPTMLSFFTLWAKVKALTDEK